MNKIKKSAFLVLVLLILFVPVVSFGAGLVPCDNVSKICDFSAFMDLLNGVISFILFKLALPLAAIMFVYAGFLLITAGGEAAHSRAKAKNIFTNAVIGLVLAAIAWIIVRTLLSILGYDGAWIGF